MHIAIKWRCSGLYLLNKMISFETKKNENIYYFLLRHQAGFDEWGAKASQDLIVTRGKSFRSPLSYFDKNSPQYIYIIT